jgi:hypothetical protein
MELHLVFHYALMIFHHHNLFHELWMICLQNLSVSLHSHLFAHLRLYMDVHLNLKPSCFCCSYFKMSFYDKAFAFFLCVVLLFKASRHDGEMKFPFAMAQHFFLEPYNCSMETDLTYWFLSWYITIVKTCCKK